MSFPTPSDRYIVVLSSNCDFRTWRESEPLSHGDQAFGSETWATWGECNKAIENLWLRRRQFSTGREYRCWGSFCNCTSYRPGYCCADCKFQASVENDPDRPDVKPECTCRHSTCGREVELADPREALDKMRNTPEEKAPEKKENESFWDKVKRIWAEAGQVEEKDSWVRNP